MRLLGILRQAALKVCNRPFFRGRILCGKYCEGCTLLSHLPQLANLSILHMQELLHHTGATSSDYDRLSSRFEESRLQDSWVMLTEHRFPRRFFHQLTANHWQKTKLDLGVDAAMLAALSVAITTGHVPQTELVLDGMPACSLFPLPRCSLEATKASHT